MTDSFQDLYDQIVAERGGAQTLGVIGQSVARALAAALIDPTTSPSTVASLAALLPAKKAPGEKPLDLRLLSNLELRQLEFLVRRATGEQVAKPPRIRRSRREDDALEAAQYIDRIARRGKKPKPTDAEMTHIRNYVYYLIRDVTYEGELFAYLAGSRPAPAFVAVPAAVVEPEATPSAPATTDNVVPLNVVAKAFGPRRWSADQTRRRGMEGANSPEHHMSNNFDATKHVVPLGFGRYGVYQGVMLNKRPLDRKTAVALANCEITTEEIMTQERRAAWEKLNAERARVQKRVEELAGADGRTASRHRLQAQTQLERLNRELTELEESNTQHAEGEVNKMQRRAALAGEPPSAAAAGVVVALAELVISGKRYHRGQVIGPVETLENWLPQNRAALIANKLIELRPASAPAT